jgi:ADP-ribose pyrophosphatase YjhB (NUDIX family)
MPRDTFCSHCGARFADTTTYPRTCPACRVQTWANPIPVAVVLVPVRDGARTGLLVVRRAIPPVGKLALIGGFVEDHESWQECAVRELREEAGLLIDPVVLAPLWYASSTPRPDRVLLFSVAPAIDAAALPPFAPNPEAMERGILFGAAAADGLAFPLHVEAARRYFAGAGEDGDGDGGFVMR